MRKRRLPELLTEDFAATNHQLITIDTNEDKTELNWLESLENGRP